MFVQSFLRWDRCAARDAVDKIGPRGRVGVAGPTDTANDTGVVVEASVLVFTFLGVARRLIVSADTDLEDVVVVVVVVVEVKVDVDVVDDEARGAAASRALVLLGRPSEAASTIAFCLRIATAFPASEALGVGVVDFLIVGVPTARGVAYTFLALELAVATGILTTLFFSVESLEGVVGVGVEDPGADDPGVGVEDDAVAGLSIRRFLEGDMGATGGSAAGLRFDPEVANLPIILRTVPGVGSELDGDSAFVLSAPSCFTSVSSSDFRFCGGLEGCDLCTLHQRV